MSKLSGRVSFLLALLFLLITGLTKGAFAQESGKQESSKKQEKPKHEPAKTEIQPAAPITFFTPGSLIVAVSGCAIEGGSCTGVPYPGVSGSINGPAGGYGDDQGSPWTLFQYSVSGATSATYVNALQLPQLTLGYNLPVSNDYGSLSEGTVQLSGDGRFLTMYGFGLNAATFNDNYLNYCPGNTGTLASSCVPENGNPAMAQTGSLLEQTYTGNTPVPRVAALIDPYGNVNSSTVLYNIHNQNDARSAYTDNGSTVYVSGQGCKTWDPNDMLCDTLENANAPYDDTMGVYLSAVGVTNDAPTPITGPDNGPTGCTTLTGCTSSIDTRMVTVYNGTVYVSLDSKPGSSTGGYNRSYVGTLGADGATSVYLCASGSAGCPTGDGPYGPSIVAGLGNSGGTGKYTINSQGSGNTSNGNALNNSGLKINLAPQNFWFASPTVLYVADTGFPKNTSNGPDAVCTADGGKSSATVGDGGLQKWILNPTVTAAVTNSGSTSTKETVTATSGAFTQGEIGLPISDSLGYIPAGTTITAVSGAGANATMSAAATGTSSSDSITVSGWSLAYTLYNGLNLVLNGDCNPSTPIGPGGNASTGLYGVTGVVKSGVATLYVTSYPNNDLINSYLYGITDTLATTSVVNGGPTFTQLATAPSDSVFRGVSMAPLTTASGGSGSLPAGSETITSTPPGASFTTSGTGCAPGTYVTPFTLTWTPGNSCTLSTGASQTISGGPVNPASTTYTFASWQDGTTNAASDVVTAPSTAAIYNINFAAVPAVYGSPLGNLETAVDSSTGSTTVPTSDSIYINGWAADATDGTPVHSIVIYIDGVSVGSPTKGESRPDVASYFSTSAYANAGFTLLYPASSLTTGPHSVTAVVTNGGGVSTTLGPLSITVTAYPPPIGNLETAQDASTGSTTVSSSDSIYINGWIADPTDGSPMSNVNVFIDGVSIGTPTLDISRPDVATYYSKPAYANSGFTMTYSAAKLASGSHAITVVGIDSHSVSTTLGPLTITVVAHPLGNLESAVDATTGSSTISQSSGDSLYIGGWAADYTDNGPAKSVQIYIDGASFAPATLGISRPDVAAYYNDSAWTNSGFQLYTSVSGLSQSSHSVTAVATDSKGDSTTLGPLTFTVGP